MALAAGRMRLAVATTRWAATAGNRGLCAAAAADPRRSSRLVRPPSSFRGLSTTSLLLADPRPPPEILPEDESNIVRSPYSDVEIPEVNLADFVWRDTDKWPNNVALVRDKDREGLQCR